MADELSQRYGSLLTGSYDSVDRIVLNAFYPLGHSPGGFRVWWRSLHDGSDEQLDQAHLLRMPGRFARRLRAWAAANNVSVIDCKRGERKHDIAESFLDTHTVVRPGVFLILVARAPATVWEVRRSPNGGPHLLKKTALVNHYSFHIMDPEWGHLTIKMAGHPPFAAQVILNGHEYVARAAHTAGIGFTKQGNCFTAVTDPQALAQVADTLSQDATVGRLSRACDRWIYSACLCFALDIEHQAKSGFRYNYSIYQVEYSRNLLFHCGATMDRVFDTMVDRTRSRLDIPTLRTLFGAKTRPHRNRKTGPPALAVVIETPQYDLTVFKVRFGRLTLKGYTKGEHVLRFEAVVHNTKELRCGRGIDKFPAIVGRLAGMVNRFCTTLDCIDVGFLPDRTLDHLPLPSQIGATKVGGIDLNKPRIRTVLAAVLALAIAPSGFTVADLAAKVTAITGGHYTTRQAAYDLRKLRGKQFVLKPGRSRRYHVPPVAARTITALLALRDHVIAPILAGVRSPRNGRKPAHWTPVDRQYETLRIGMQKLFTHLGIDHATP